MFIIHTKLKSHLFSHPESVLHLLFDASDCVALSQEDEEGAAKGTEDLLAVVRHRDQDVSLLQLLLLQRHLLQPVILGPSDLPRILFNSSTSNEWRSVGVQHRITHSYVSWNCKEIFCTGSCFRLIFPHVLKKLQFYLNLQTLQGLLRPGQPEYLVADDLHQTEIAAPAVLQLQLPTPLGLLE